MNEFLTEDTAKQLASIVGGEAENTGGNVWVVGLTRSNGEYVVFCDSGIYSYPSKESFENGDYATSWVDTF